MNTASSRSHCMLTLLVQQLATDRAEKASGAHAAPAATRAAFTPATRAAFTPTTRLRSYRRCWPRGS